MKRFALLLITVLHFPCGSQTLPGPVGSVAILLDSAEQCIMNQQYDTSRRLLKGILAREPANIRARYLQVMVEQTRILDYESYLVDSQSFLISADSIRNYLEARIGGLTGRDSIDCLFYLANVYGGISVIQGKTGNWFDGLKNALTSITFLKQVLKLDPDYSAANLGIGIFEYYLNSSFKWLPFMEDRQDKGVGLIEQATRASFPFNYAAKNSLCWILIEQQKYKRSDSIAASVLAQYPANTIFLRIRALSAFRAGDQNNAVIFAEKLLKSTVDRKPSNWSDLITSYFIMIHVYEQKGMPADSRKAVSQALAMKIPPAYAEIPHVKKHYAYISLISEKYRAEKP